MRNSKLIRENPETSRAGIKWTEQEENELIESLGVESIETIALRHKRTNTAILAKRNQIAYELVINDGLSLEDAADALGISVLHIREIIGEIKLKQDKKPKISKKIIPKKTNNILVLDEFVGRAESENKVLILERDVSRLKTDIAVLEARIDDLFKYILTIKSEEVNKLQL